VSTRDSAISVDRDQLDSLLHGVSDIVTVIDAEARLRYVSPSTVAMLGFPASEMLGKAALEFVHPDDLARVEKQFVQEGWKLKTESGAGLPESLTGEAIEIPPRRGGWYLPA